MPSLSHSLVKQSVSRNDAIFTRGENLFALGNYSLFETDASAGRYTYLFDGSYGEYRVTIRLKEGAEGTVDSECSCPSANKAGEEIRPELDERTPHFLNPEIFRETDRVVDISAEETLEQGDEESRSDASPAGSPEELEAVLNQGMSFLNSLAMMATGKPITGSESSKAVEIDRETGEVVMRFKLPGF